MRWIMMELEDEGEKNAQIENERPRWNSVLIKRERERVTGIEICHCFSCCSCPSVLLCLQTENVEEAGEESSGREWDWLKCRRQQIPEKERKRRGWKRESLWHHAERGKEDLLFEPPRSESRQCLRFQLKYSAVMIDNDGNQFHRIQNNDCFR